VVASVAAEREDFRSCSPDSAAVDGGAVNIRVALGPEIGALLFGVQFNPAVRLRAVMLDFVHSLLSARDAACTPGRCSCDG
jgi:hypothetical protein